MADCSFLHNEIINYDVKISIFSPLFSTDIEENDIIVLFSQI